MSHGGVPETVRGPDFAIDVPRPCQVSTNEEYLAIASLENVILIWSFPLDKKNLSPDVQLRNMKKNKTEIRFNLPQGVSIKGNHLFVADTNFHRILIWNEIPISNEIPPDIILGQENFELEDAFSHTTRDGLFMPGNIYFDGSYLWVAEAKFSDRLLRFKIVEQE